MTYRLHASAKAARENLVKRLRLWANDPAHSRLDTNLKIDLRQAANDAEDFGYFILQEDKAFKARLMYDLEEAIREFYRRENRPDLAGALPEDPVGMATYELGTPYVEMSFKTDKLNITLSINYERELV